jgi:methionyl-tRNA synthetase
MELADQVNIFVDSNKPWEIAKTLGESNDPEISLRLQEVCSITLEAFRILTIYLKPVLPELAKNVEVFLGIPSLKWSSVEESLNEKNVIQPYKHLMSRIDPALIEKLINANKTVSQPTS